MAYYSPARVGRYGKTTFASVRDPSVPNSVEITLVFGSNLVVASLPPRVGTPADNKVEMWRGGSQSAATTYGIVACGKQA